MGAVKKEPKTMAQGLIRGLQEAVEYGRGQIKAKEHEIDLPGPAPKWTTSTIKKLRAEYGLSQPHFAALLNVKTSTVRSWEQGQKTPSGAAARLLQLLALDHKLIGKLVA